MNRYLLTVALTAVSLATPALAKGDRLVRVCNADDACKRVPQARVRSALLAVGGQLPPTSEAAASAANNRRELSALLAKLR